MKANSTSNVLTRRSFWETVLHAQQIVNAPHPSKQTGPVPGQEIDKEEDRSQTRLNRERQALLDKTALVPFDESAPRRGVPRLVARHRASSSSPTPSSKEKCVDESTERSDQAATSADAAKDEANVPHRCKICSASFTRASELQSHLRTIHKSKSFSCDVCPATFGHISSKYRHHRTVHLKRRDFSCDQCHQTFTERSAVAKHRRTVHEGTRPYPCPICGFRFYFKLHCEQHVATVHEKRRPFQCKLCGMCFGQRSSMNRHIKHIHGLSSVPSSANGVDN